MGKWVCRGFATEMEGVYCGLVARPWVWCTTDVAKVNFGLVIWRRETERIAGYFKLGCPGFEINRIIHSS